MLKNCESDTFISFLVLTEFYLQFYFLEFTTPIVLVYKV